MQGKVAKGSGVDRRGFLRGMGGATTAAVAVAAGSLAATDAEAYDPGTPETDARYKPDAQDVQAFYRTNGYETMKK